MSPRKYDRRTRLAAAAQTRERIVRATVELHARHGALGTTHDMIARRAGVSLPTVYKYFPTRNDLIPACTGQVLREAPRKLDESALGSRTDVPSRLRSLARRCSELYDHAARWLRWSARDATELPALREVLDEMERGLEALLRLALAPGFERAPPRRLLAVSLVLLGFPSWQSLTGQGFTSEGAARAVGDVLVSLYDSTRKEKGR